jgi:hypothetical protein
MIFVLRFMAGAVERVRPKMMTVFAIMAGLLPIMWSHGTGAEVMQRIAVPMIGGHGVGPPLRPAVASAQREAISGACSLLQLPLSQRIAAGITAEGLKQHAMKAEFARIAELLDANRHGFVASGRLCPVGSEKPVPPG